jgi:hypothetical protein
MTWFSSNNSVFTWLITISSCDNDACALKLCVHTAMAELSPGFNDINSTENIWVIKVNIDFYWMIIFRKLCSFLNHYLSWLTSYWNGRTMCSSKTKVGMVQSGRFYTYAEMKKKKDFYYFLHDLTMLQYHVYIHLTCRL